MCDAVTSWKQWLWPLHRDEETLRAAMADLSQVGAGDQEIPLIVQLVENPRYRMPGLEIFHGAVDLRTHDALHILLGRGLLAKDEAFTIGFTMGSTNRVTTVEETLYGFLAKNLYPRVYRFDEEALEVFRNGVRLGYVSACEPLDRIDIDALLDLPLRTARARIGLEEDLLRAYYRIEARRYPDEIASQRLLINAAD